MGYVLNTVRSGGRRRAAEIDELTQLRDVADHPSIDHALQVVRELLDMDVAYTTELTPTLQIFQHLSGDSESFGLAEGAAMDIDATYCKRVLDGRLSGIMPDVKGDPRSASLPITVDADVGAFVSVPLRLSDGTVPGTLCAASHAPKPGLGYRDLQFLRVFARLIADQIERHNLEEGRRDLERQAAAAEILMTAVAARDSYTADHSRQVVEHAVAVGRILGRSGDDLADLEKVALLHDIGKIGTPDEILRKPGPLSPAEWETMREHPILGERLIRETTGLEHLGPALRAEHERWDGSGYPDGLAAEEIPIASRITFVCDAYNAMTTDRPYRSALPEASAREAVRSGAGSQFCPVSAAALLAVLDRN
ncbi:MAG: HD domain-containing protein [Solirubrobacterales bacterium]|nr:HD domain-containing protein [Solirubrobacterales bacterium]